MNQPLFLRLKLWYKCLICKVLGFLLFCDQQLLHSTPKYPLHLVCQINEVISGCLVYSLCLSLKQRIPHRKFPRSLLTFGGTGTHGRTEDRGSLFLAKSNNCRGGCFLYLTFHIQISWCQTALENARIMISRTSVAYWWPK